MAKYRIQIRETVYSVYDFDVPNELLTDNQEENEVIAEDYFCNKTPIEQEEYLIDTDSFTWEVDGIELKD